MDQAQSFETSCSLWVEASVISPAGVSGIRQERAQKTSSMTKAGLHDVPDPSTQKRKADESEIQVHFQLHSNFEASLGYWRSVSSKQTKINF